MIYKSFPVELEKNSRYLKCVHVREITAYSYIRSCQPLMRIGQIIKLLICNLLSLFVHFIFVVPLVVFSILYIIFKLKIYIRNQGFYYYCWQRFKYLKFCSDVINLFIWLFNRHWLSIDQVSGTVVSKEVA